jgi:predicted cupin superfamily sugar epimerase
LRDARYFIDRLRLQRHPEGGYFRETFRSAQVLEAPGPGYPGPRVASTDIYFLLEAGDVSALHRLASEERWHFHAGGPMTIFAIFEDGSRHDLRLGPNLDEGEEFQVGVPARSVFGARVDASSDPERAFCLVSCTVAPGFDFADFELCDRAALLSEFPAHRTLIDELARDR